MKPNLSLTDYAFLRKRRDEHFGWTVFWFVTILFSSGLWISYYLPLETYERKTWIVEEKNKISTYLSAEEILFPLDQMIWIDEKNYSVEEIQYDPNIVVEQGNYMKKVSLRLNGDPIGTDPILQGKILTRKTTLLRYLWSFLTGGDK